MHTGTFLGLEGEGGGGGEGQGGGFFTILVHSFDSRRLQIQHLPTSKHHILLAKVFSW